LAPASAAVIVEVVLIDRAEDRSAHLQYAVERDPGLALWAFCRASLDGVLQTSGSVFRPVDEYDFDDYRCGCRRQRQPPTAAAERKRWQTEHRRLCVVSILRDVAAMAL
jgi:hypothetical protein